MKKGFLINCLLLAMFLNINYTNAAIIEITAAGSSLADWAFTPVNPTINVGDTIRWLNLNGVHTSASTTIPVGAAPWDANIPTNGTAYFEYRVTVPGTYNYTCHKSFNNGTGHGMNGSFVAVGTLGISSAQNVSYSSSYPVPFSNSVTIEFLEGDLLVLNNINGVEIKNISLNQQQRTILLDLTELCKGYYFYSVFKQDVLLETRKIFKQ